MSRAWASIVPGSLLISRAINGQLVHRDQCARRAVVIVAALLGLDVPVDRARDRSVRAASLVLVKAAPLRGTASGAPRAGLWP